MLTDTELAQMREAIEDILAETCTIYVRSMIGDGQGGKYEQWDDGTAESCRVMPMSAEDATRYAEKLGAQSGWVITLPYYADVNVYDKVVADGVEYRVVGTNENESWIMAKRAYCARVK